MKQTICMIETMNKAIIQIAVTRFSLFNKIANGQEIQI